MANYVDDDDFWRRRCQVTLLQEPILSSCRDRPLQAVLSRTCVARQTKATGRHRRVREGRGGLRRRWRDAG